MPRKKNFLISRIIANALYNLAITSGAQANREFGLENSQENFLEAANALQSAKTSLLEAAELLEVEVDKAPISWDKDTVAYIRKLVPALKQEYQKYLFHHDNIMEVFLAYGDIADKIDELQSGKSIRRHTGNRQQAGNYARSFYRRNLW